jgi:myo-inositol-1(or 4)-monophosphatase
VKRHFRPSLAWRLCLVGQGRFDIMVTLRAAYEWDIAAGSLIAAEAGATVTDGEGAALEFNRHPARAPGVIAAPEALHRALMARRCPD